jgi:two-component system, response regulator PdtaR
MASTEPRDIGRSIHSGFPAVREAVINTGALIELGLGTMQPHRVAGCGAVDLPARALSGLILGRGAGGPKPRRRAARTGEDRDLTAVSVLVVEDEALVAMNLTAMLEDLGAEVCATVASGKEAVRRARLLRPQLAVVDVRLKDGETGIDAARIMADELGTAIVFATAHSDPHIVGMMSAVPGAQRLFKPYDAGQLADAMRRALRRQ